MQNERESKERGCFAVLICEENELTNHHKKHNSLNTFHFITFSTEIQLSLTDWAPSVASTWENCNEARTNSTALDSTKNISADISNISIKSCTSEIHSTHGTARVLSWTLQWSKRFLCTLASKVFIYQHHKSCIPSNISGFHILSNRSAQTRVRPRGFSHRGKNFRDWTRNPKRWVGRARVETNLDISPRKNSCSSHQVSRSYINHEVLWKNDWIRRGQAIDG